MSYEIKIGDVFSKLQEIDDDSVDCVVTSPPYYGLRDYGTGTWVGGNPDCEHQGEKLGNNRNFIDFEGRGSNNASLETGDCIKCGATKKDSQIGLEESPQQYIERLVEVFRDVRRVLKPTGTVWLNIADTYCSTGKSHGLKPKSLILIPFRLAIALQEDGWIVRQDIIWTKNNPMPESVKDRCTKAHEYIFLLTKSKRYYYNNNAILEPCVSTNTKKTKSKKKTKYGSIENESKHRQGMHQQRGENLIETRPLLPHQTDFVAFMKQTPKKVLYENTDIKHTTIDHYYRNDEWFSYPTYDDWKTIYPFLQGEKENMNNLLTYVEIKTDVVKESKKNMKNKRSVWNVNTKPYKKAHFAVYPPELIEPCILTTPKLVCASCGIGYVEKQQVDKILTSEEVEEIKRSIVETSTKQKKPYAVIEKEFRNQVIEFRNLPQHDLLRTYLSKWRKKAGLTIDEIENHFGTQAPHHWFEKGGSYPTVEDFLILKELLGLDNAFDKQLTQVFYKSGLKNENSYSTVAIVKDCVCETNETTKAIILDPFAGSGTTGGVAEKHGRDSILIELNPEYASFIPERIEQIAGENNEADSD